MRRSPARIEWAYEKCIPKRSMRPTGTDGEKEQTMLTDPSSALRRLVAWLKVAGLAILFASVVLAAHRHYTVSAPAAIARSSAV